MDACIIVGLEGPKLKSQAFDPPDPESLQSQIAAACQRPTPTQRLDTYSDASVDNLLRELIRWPLETEVLSESLSGVP